MPPDATRLSILETQVSQQAKTLENIDDSLRDISQSLRLLAKIEAHSEAHSQQLERVSADFRDLEKRVRDLEAAVGSTSWTTKLVSSGAVAVVAAVGVKALGLLGL